MTIECTPVTVAFNAARVPQDSIADLTATLLRTAHAQTGSTEVLFNQEPEQMRLEFSRSGPLLQMCVDAVGSSEQSTLLAHRAPVAEVIRPFVAALSGVEAALTDAEYEAAWGFRFPHDGLERLRTLAGI